ncbi:bifunctional diguanylate cyclase/phosphodiesterase [Neiella marina]|uniref:Bifunctional diguanylate cyclase/phosphodiesterase n=1 Tax=Neiella holothuriorum TaxID=2870530 RepID=A0ABS7EKD9_9GAMM|nr:bifunctional diguanylate cyclase/phosphodiesterase [Neiella holothuriorum]MBW8192822.1 bifunctional diguanylate cyclase/phosphodiesterase [Neiella holothuriorum]
MLNSSVLARFKHYKVTIKARAYRAFVSFSENPKRYSRTLALLLVGALLMMLFESYQLQHQLSQSSQHAVITHQAKLEALSASKFHLSKYQLLVENWPQFKSLKADTELEQARATANEQLAQLDEQHVSQLWQQVLALDYQLQLVAEPSSNQALALVNKLNATLRDVHLALDQSNTELFALIQAQSTQNQRFIDDAKQRSLYLDGATLLLVILAFAVLYRYFRASQFYRHKAFHDRVTGLPNQSKMLLDLHQKRHGNMLLLALELNNIEHYVAGQGYNIIEQIHQSFSHHLLNVLAQLELNYFQVYRSGKGIYLIKGCVADQNKVAEVIKRIRAALIKPISTSIGEYHPRWNRGATLISPNTAPEKALDQLYAALAEAGYEGQDSLQFFSSALRDKRKRRWKLQQLLGQAMRENQLALHYQPQFEMKSGRLMGVEALLRWQINGKNVASPAEFIPVAEQTGLIIEMGRWVIRTAIHQAAFWYHHNQPVKVAINISPRQFEHPDFISELKQLLNITQLPPKFIELEITEGVLMKDAQGGLATLHDLKKIGVSLAIDDFGQGYSSLSYLHRFPIDKLKIDRSFVTDVHHSEMDQVIARIIIELGKQLQLEVIAEGVELDEQAQWLITNGCQLAQGYLMGKPVSCGELQQLLDQQQLPLPPITPNAE